MQLIPDTAAVFNQMRTDAGGQPLPAGSPIPVKRAAADAPAAAAPPEAQQEEPEADPPIAAFDF